MLRGLVATWACAIGFPMGLIVVNEPYLGEYGSPCSNLQNPDAASAQRKLLLLKEWRRTLDYFAAAAGGMFWFTRKKFVGSYLVLMSASLS